MRTTIHLNDQLFRQIKQWAAESHKTLTAIIEDALREVLVRRKMAVRKKGAALPVFKGQGLQPAVDLDHTANLLDIMENRH
ncbi:MAG: ribbon-helix-helix protein, CopG family [Elusimicrobia bacterium]|nr:ribbon-helix-helix protein, CopG family [Elusimicrobiota bacterium]